MIKKMFKNKKILVLAISVLLVTTANFAIAVNPSVFVSPSGLEKEKGQSFNLAISVSGAGQKVCVIEGKINLNNLSCQNIVLSDGLSPQTSPTCANPSFLLGIQGCNSGVKNLFTLTVKSTNSGSASVTFLNVDIIGEGVSISNASVGGNYDITVPVVVQPKETPEETPKEVATPQQEESTPTPVVVTIPEANVAQASLLTAIANILSFRTGKSWLSIIVTILIILALVILIFYLIRKRSRKKI